MKVKLPKFKQIIEFFQEFMDAKPFTYSSSIAFYTIFSLPAVIYLVVLTSSVIYGEDAVTGRLSEQINQMVGQKSAETIESILKTVNNEGDTLFATILSFITLIIGSTTVFGAIQTGLNEIWGIKESKKSGFIKLIINKVFSFTVVVSMGFLMIVSLLIETFMTYFYEYLTRIFPNSVVFLAGVTSIIISIIVTGLLFTLIMKVLPDQRIKWKHAFYGGLFTSLLFFIGKYLIGFYLSHSNPATSYGAAGSLVLILVWVYYSSLILLLGGKITHSLEEKNNRADMKVIDIKTEKLNKI